MQWTQEWEECDKQHQFRLADIQRRLEFQLADSRNLLGVAELLDESWYFIAWTKIRFFFVYLFDDFFQIFDMDDVADEELTHINNTSRYTASFSKNQA